MSHAVTPKAKSTEVQGQRARNWTMKLVTRCTVYNKGRVLVLAKQSFTWNALCNTKDCVEWCFFVVLFLFFLFLFFFKAGKS